jgi:hypothetical protein
MAVSGCGMEFNLYLCNFSEPFDSYVDLVIDMFILFGILYEHL